MALTAAIRSARAGATILTALLAFPPSMPGVASRREVLRAESRSLRAARRAKFAELWADAALSVADIGDRLCVTPAAVRYMAKSAGLPARSVRAEWTHERRAELAALWRNPELSEPEIAARLGVTPGAVRALARRLRLSLRREPPPLAWTPERDELGAALWRDGLSSARCLPLLNALPGAPLSQSAIECRAVKLEWRREVKAKPLRAVANTLSAAPWGSPDPCIVRLIAAPDPTRETCRTRPPNEPCAPHICQWPFGNPREFGFLFCAEARAPKSGSYCRTHAERAYFQQPRP